MLRLNTPKFLFCIIILLLVSSVFGAEIQFLFPIPGTEYHDPGTVLILRFWDVKADQITNLNSFISMRGQISGPVGGKTVVANDGRTINFRPDANFALGEWITVHLAPQGIGQSRVFADTSFQFKIRNDFPPYELEPERDFRTRGNESPDVIRNQIMSGPDPLVLNGVSLPSDFPVVDVLTSDNPDSGYIFTGKVEDNRYFMILDNDANPVWYRRVTTGKAFDLKVQPDGRLTMTSPYDMIHWMHIAMDSTYTVVDTFRTAMGYWTDMHDLQVMPNGDYYLINGNHRQVDMSEVVPGGDPNAYVVDNFVVGMDADGNLIFFGRSQDWYAISNAIHVDLTQSIIDYVHMNAIEMDLDGNLLVSARHQDEITKINRLTAEPIWRLGGRYDWFAWIDDADKLSYQHDIRVLPNGHYTILDNGNFHTTPLSRALELDLNTDNWTVTKVWEYNSGYIQSKGMGNAQRLPNGNTLINWGYVPYPILTEVRPDGSKALEMAFSDGGRSYRTFKFPWKGKAAVPYLILEHQGDRITLLFNKFGDLDVDHYNIYADTSPHPTEIIAASSRSFKHLIQELENNRRYYFRVTAVSTSGEESPFSNESDVFVNLTLPGQTLIHNGNFSDGVNYWHGITADEVRGYWGVTAQEELHLAIQDGGSEPNDFMFVQYDIPVLEGRTYQLGFDAYADMGRIFEVAVYKDASPWPNVSQNGPSWITTQKQHFTYDFVLNEPGINEVFVALKAGGSNHDVYVDNVSLIQLLDTSFPEANFRTDITEGVAPLTVPFTDLSTGSITSWAWDFGDGETSTDQHPSHTFQSADTFSISLTVTGPQGSDTATKEDYIVVLEPPPVADFTADTTEGTWPFLVQFQDLSNGPVTVWAWHFGDGETSAEQHPAHTYQSADTFTVSLEVTGPGGADTLTQEAFIKVSDPPPVADFTADTTRGLFPLDVHFSDLSTGPVFTWLWDFGDGEQGREQNPAHTYAAMDSFTVSLIATGPGGSDTLTRPDYIITSGPAPTAGFSADTTCGAVPLEVGFTDESIGMVDTWSWDFGDGQSSAEQHPIHTFETVDTFTVSLIVSGPSGADTLIRPEYITVTDPPPVSDFTADTTWGQYPFEVHFTDLSTGVVTSLFWDFGDSTTSEEQHPAHVYQTADTFDVTLMATGPGGSHSKTAARYITVFDPPPAADFTADTTEGMIPLQVQFSDLSNGPVTAWIWDFGDGRFSTDQHPFHTYQDADTFDVSLTVTGPGGEDTKLWTEYIITSNPSGVDKSGRQIPTEFALAQNYPNPFNMSTTIDYAVPEPSQIRIAIYNVKGECVCELMNGQCDPGLYQIHFDASELGSGLYFYRMENASNSEDNASSYTKKLILLK